MQLRRGDEILVVLERSVGVCVNAAIIQQRADDVGEWERARHDELDGVIFLRGNRDAAMRYL